MSAPATVGITVTPVADAPLASLQALSGGSGEAFGPVVSISDLDGSNGFILSGIAESNFTGRAVANAGDVNGDGIDDLIVGAHGVDQGDLEAFGAAYVVFGSASGFPADFDLGSLDGTNGFEIAGLTASDNAGWSVAGIGDFDGDGLDDVAVGTRDGQFFTNNGSVPNGEAYVIFGDASGYGGSVSATALNGANGFRIVGKASIFETGQAVAGAGDVNNDGFDDLLVGADQANLPGRTNAGEAYLIFGRPGGFGPLLDLDVPATLNGVNGVSIQGLAQDNAGVRLSGAGDINGDGFDDMVVGTDDEGRAYVVFGSGSLPAAIDVDTLNGANGFTLVASNRTGADEIAVSNAGDVNGDGIADLLIGNPAADRTNGAGQNVNEGGTTFVLFGTENGFSSTIDLRDIGPAEGFAIDGFGNSGSAVAPAGDVNNDGIDDLIIGADPRGGLSDAYVVFGSSGGFPDRLRVEDLDGTNGFAFDGFSTSVNALWYAAVGGGGDVNADGIDDVIVGNTLAVRSDGLETGQAYVIFGRDGAAGLVLDLDVASGDVDGSEAITSATLAGLPADFTLSDGLSSATSDGTAPLDLSGFDLSSPLALVPAPGFVGEVTVTAFVTGSELANGASATTTVSATFDIGNDPAAAAAFGAPDAGIAADTANFALDNATFAPSPADSGPIDVLFG